MVVIFPAPACHTISSVSTVVSETGAIVVIPEPLVRDSTTHPNAGAGNGKGDGGGVGYCWKAFEHYGYCGPTSPEDSEDVDFISAMISSLQQVCVHACTARSACLSVCVTMKMTRE